MRAGVFLFGTMTIALVASGVAKAHQSEATLPRAVWNWSGGYIGGHVGGGYGRTSFSNPYGPSIYGGVVDTPAFLAGGQIGYNWQNNSWVFGIELDVSGAVSEGTNTCLAPSGFVVSANCKAGPSLFATGTGRVGYAFGALGHTLAYLKAGVAWQNNRGDVVNNLEGGGLPQEKTHFDYGRLGGVIGLGVERALTPAWSVNVEYDYLHFWRTRCRDRCDSPVPVCNSAAEHNQSVQQLSHRKDWSELPFRRRPAGDALVRYVAIREGTRQHAARSLRDRLVIRRRLPALAQSGMIPMGRSAPWRISRSQHALIEAHLSRTGRTFGRVIRPP
ncbi:opacity protein-like surface antigen [Bradyrhizobium sp. USDA 4524]|uniref:outer membrane protein n=2 Tax=Bradyrhizobium TaxID=374 RepID=UPI002810DC47|nr:outer membrane beta-barrel protein [Bradyrhizobium sp. USDA 4539]